MKTVTKKLICPILPLFASNAKNERIEISSIFINEYKVEYSVFCSLNEMHGT